MTTKHNMELNDMELTQVSGGEINFISDEDLERLVKDSKNWINNDPVPYIKPGPYINPTKPVPFDVSAILVDPSLYERDLPAAM